MASPDTYNDSLDDWIGESSNPYLAILEEAPGAAYHSYRSDWGAAPTQQQYYQTQFQNVYNQYLGTLGAALRQGGAGEAGAPSVSDIGQMNFHDYLSDYEWTDRYTSLPPAMRGDYTSQFNPRTRQIYF